MPIGIVARVGELGTEEESRREIAVSRWLNDCGIRAVRAVEGLTQPTIVNGFTVSWWERLPSHRPATPDELGVVLRRLHATPTRPGLDLPALDPLESVRDRLASIASLDKSSHRWLVDQTSDLQNRYLEISSSIPTATVHGDAWQGNVAVTEDGEAILLDFEETARGPRYWDLIPIAVDYTDFARLSEMEYAGFVSSYGFDVTSIDGYRTLAEIQELRWLSFILGKMGSDRDATVEAHHRIACLRGEIPKPWKWRAY